MVHSALNKFLATPEYHIHNAIVLSNEQTVYNEHDITYLPIYYCMFFKKYEINTDEELIIPEVVM